MLFAMVATTVAPRRKRQESGRSNMNLFDLSGRVAVITGGNGGIGLGMAQGLASQGCAVSLWGRNADKNAQAAEVIRKLGGKVDTQVCDVADPAQIKQSFAATLQKFCRVDGIFA